MANEHVTFSFLRFEPGFSEHQLKKFPRVKNGIPVKKRSSVFSLIKIGQKYIFLVFVNF